MMLGKKRPFTAARPAGRQTHLAMPVGVRAVLVAIVVAWISVSQSLLFASSPPQKRQVSEFDLKAVYLYQFAQFVTWPKYTFKNDKSPFRVGIVGKDPFGARLERAFKGKKVGGRRVEIKRYASAEDFKLCHILYVSRSEKDKVQKILAACHKKPVLLVSDLEDFTKGGGIVRFYPDGKKIRLEINFKASKDASLKIDSRLLALARVLK